MRSRADASRARVAVEWVLRAVALAALATLLWRAWRPAAPRRARVVDPGAIAALRDSTAAGDTLALRLPGAPGAAARAELAALAAAGRTVQWTDAGVPALVADVEPPRAPDAAPRLVAVAPRATPLALGDVAGTLDSVAARDGAVALEIAGDGRGLVARAGATTARASVRDSLAPRRVLVVGRAGWEAKFTVAALEEAGWRVDAELDVAPGARVRQGALVPDTARHAAVVVLDAGPATLAHAAAIARFVRAGGGLVLAGDAAAVPAFGALRAGVPGPRVPGEAGALAATNPRRGLPLRPVRAGADAVVLERRGGLVAAAARRIASGRVVQLGYEDTWRWRMEGDEAAPASHRRWWSAVVASAARAPVVARSDTSWPGTHDPAPRAALVAALGAPRTPGDAPAAPTRGRGPADSLLAAGATLALLLEWASRRLRGAR